MTFSCTAPRQGHRPGSAAERACPEHGRQASREVLPVAVVAPVSSDEPTVVVRYDDGTVMSEEWLVDGKPHRTDGPAAVWYHPDGTINFEKWLVDGKPHRTDGPASVWHRPDGTVEEWFVDGKPHRTDGPARVWYHSDGSVEREEWLVGGEFHRTDGPAVVRYHSDGTVESETWHVDGEEVDGPAPVLATFLRSRVPHITTSAARFLCEARPWQEWADISDEEIELAMTLYPDFAEA